MKWLVDCDDVDVEYRGLADQRPRDFAGTTAPDVAVEENGEELVDVRSRLSSWWVYSWMDLDFHATDLLLRRSVLDRLLEVNDGLPPDFELVVLDGWRPIRMQAELYVYYGKLMGKIPSGFVAEPDPQSGEIPPHTTGGAVDLTLSWRGAPLGLGSDFDEFSPASALDYEHLSPRAKSLRALLSNALLDSGFVPYSLEWWHWSYGDQLWAKATGRPHAIYGEIVEP